MLLSWEVAQRWPLLALVQKSYQCSGNPSEKKFPGNACIWISETGWRQSKKRKTDTDCIDSDKWVRAELQACGCKWEAEQTDVRNR